jgi:hypothetical protein
LLGFFEFDFLVYLVLGLLLLSLFPKERLLLLLIGAGGAGVVILRFLNFEQFSFLLLGIISSVTGFWCIYKEGQWDILRGFVLPLLILESAFLLSSLSFYLYGEWFPFFFNIVLKERLIWSLLEWVVVPLFFLGSLGSWYYKFFRGGSSRDINGVDFDGKVLLYSIFLIVVLVVLPHLSSVNPGFKAISVDTEAYGEVFMEAHRNGLVEVIGGQPGKPVYFLFLYGVWVLTGRRTILLMDLIHPVLVLSGLAIVSAYVTRERGGGSYSSLLVPLGYSLTGFVGGGFQADSLALIPCIVAIYLDREKPHVWTKVTLLMILTGLIHSWTYLMYGAAIIAMEFLERRDLRKSLLILAASYGVVNLVDYLIDLSLEVTVVSTGPVLTEVGFYLFGNWFKSLNFWVWNSLSNPIYMMGSLFSLDGVSSSLLAVSAPLMLVLPANLVFRLICMHAKHIFCQCRTINIHVVHELLPKRKLNDFFQSNISRWSCFPWASRIGAQSLSPRRLHASAPPQQVYARCPRALRRVPHPLWPLSPFLSSRIISVREYGDETYS